MDGLVRAVDEGFYVAPQIAPEDVAAIKAAGVRTIVNNRPDGEAPGQPTGAEIEAAATAAGLAYVAVPVVPGGLFPDHVAAMREAVEANEGPFLAYCRSGTRSCHLWALVAAQKQAPNAVIEKAAAAGYDVAAMRPLLMRINAARPGD
ncbi:MAG: TIGR01244 family phosphatase [Geminicoccaceae bacterium]|nr:TIGR01244 family phosphatase [Geminicoccaceae bacterium]